MLALKGTGGLRSRDRSASDPAWPTIDVMLEPTRRRVMTEQWKPGDVVVLKSGGPKMTIKFVEHGEACCTWFQGGKVSEQRFSLEMLQAPRGIEMIPLSRA